MRKCTKRWLLPVFAAAMTLSAGFSSLAEARFIFRWERQSPFLKGQNWQ